MPRPVSPAYGGAGEASVVLIEAALTLALFHVKHVGHGAGIVPRGTMLDVGRRGHQSGNVTDADALRQRGWAILQRLQTHAAVSVPHPYESGIASESEAYEVEPDEGIPPAEPAGGDPVLEDSANEAGNETEPVHHEPPRSQPIAISPATIVDLPEVEPTEADAHEADALGIVAIAASPDAALGDASPPPPPQAEAAPVAVASGPVNPFVRPLPRVMAVANQKGGVGKTTTAVNVGAALAELGYRVLVVDLDPQGNATTGLGVNPRNLDSSIYDVIMRETPLEDCIEPTSLRNLFVAPATINLAGAEIELVPAFSRELKLRRALEQVMDDFDYILIDCPPSLGLLTVNGLGAASEVLVPIQCEYYALEGLGQLLRNVGLVQGQINPGLEVSAIVLTMYDARTKLAEQVAREVREHFGAKVCRNIVPRTVRLSEAPSYGQPIVVFDPTSRGAIAYREIAKEVSGGAPQRVG